MISDSCACPASPSSSKIPDPRLGKPEFTGLVLQKADANLRRRIGGCLMIGRSNWRASASTAVLALALSLGAAAMPEVAHARAAQQNQVVAFDIPAGPLADSLRRYAEATGLQTVYSSGLVEGLRSPAVQGRHTAADGLSVLLAGTGLSARQSGSTIALERSVSGSIADDGSRVLGPVRVEGSQSTFAYSGGPVRGDGIAQLGGVRGGQDEEATGYRANVATVGGIAPVAIEDIPRSISVLTQEQIQKQDIQDIGDALRRLPGVALIEQPSAGMNSGSRVVSRGFDIQRVQIDGGASRPLNILGNGMLDLAQYERVELVRGPNAVFSGASSPGGSLNLVRKRPGDVERSEITAVLGSFDRRSLQVDYSTPSIGGSPLAFRGVASIADQNFFYDKSARTNALLYGVLDAPLGEKARLELGAQYTLVDDQTPYSGLFRYSGGELIDLGDYFLNLSPAWTTDRHESAGAFARLYVDIADDIDLQVGLDFESGSQFRRRSNVGFNYVEGSGLSLGSGGGPFAESLDDHNLSFDFKMTGKTRFLGLDHAWFLAGELTESGTLPTKTYDAGVYFSFANLDAYLAYMETYTPTFSTVSPIGGEGGATTRAGLVIGDVISWQDKIELSLSARRYFSDTSNFFTVANEGVIYDISGLGPRIGSGRAEDEWVPSWSLAFKPTRQLTFYGTRAEGREEVFTPKYTVAGKILEPSTYDNLEGGVKFATDRWLATLSYFDMTQENVPQPIFGSTCLPTNTTASMCYEVETASTKSKGVDFEIAGELFSGFNVVASYTWADVEHLSTGLNASSQTPANAAQLLIDWSPGSMPRTSFRAGVRYRGEVFQSGYRFYYDPLTGAFLDFEEYNFSEAAYTAFDFGIRHQLTDQVSLDVFAENITDERYLSTITAAEGNYPGAPRSVVATLRWTPFDPDSPRSTTGLAPFGDPADWYAAVETGLHVSNELNPKAEGVSQDGVTPVDWTFETEDKAIGIVRLGYRLSPSWRAEVEGSFRKADFTNIGGGAAAPFGVCSSAYADLGVAFDCDTADGGVAQWTFMLNGLHDFGAQDARFRPFVGLGLGLSRNLIDFTGKMEGIGLDSPWNQSSRRHVEEAIGGDTSRVAFTYQLQGGLSWRLNAQATIDATYRYTATPALAWGSYNLDGVGGFPAYGDPWPALTGRVGDFEASHGDHAFTVGLRWAFGAR